MRLVFRPGEPNLNGGTISDGPNYIDSSVLCLWGNNRVNATGDDKIVFTTAGGFALDLDHYGTAVPEPGITALLAIGLIGFGVVRRKKSAQTR